jgi:hypothetical protein
MRKALRSILILVFGICFAVACSVLNLVKGWGLEPKSWGWILIGGVLGPIVAHSIIGLGGKGE